MEQPYREAARIIAQARNLIVFTGAGISVESGIPPFRGPQGLWSRYDPMLLEIGYFRRNPLQSWQLIKEIFYDYFGQAQPNPAHQILADWEKRGLVKTLITQNIDHLHQIAGSQNVIEFHGTSRYVICDQCHDRQEAVEINLNELPPICSYCGGLLRPDFVFFGEPIPEPANTLAFAEAEKADVLLIIGTTGEIMPASLIPKMAHARGATIIEINPQQSNFTSEITKIFIPEKASTALKHLNAILKAADFEGSDDANAK